MAEVSIIVPVYQVEKYIRPCVDSILAQTFTDFEVILVDDGSTDESGKMCDEYAGMDRRVKVIHQRNGGVAAARNRGMESAVGNYICFVDGDDRIDATMVEKCVSMIRDTGADLLRHGHIMELWKEGKCVSTEEKNAPDFTRIMTSDEISAEMESFWKNCSNYVWNYFFQRDMIGQVQFPDIKISEDHIFVLKVMEKCRKICFLTENLYHYCMRMGSCANRWQETGIDCQMKMIHACNEFMDHFAIEENRKKRLMSQMVLNAYSYAIYLLCFPECKWTLKEKMKKAERARRNLELDQYVPYRKMSGLSRGDRIKLQLICFKKEKWLLILGPIFMKVVRKANG